MNEKMSTKSRLISPVLMFKLLLVCGVFLAGGAAIVYSSDTPVPAKPQEPQPKIVKLEASVTNSVSGHVLGSKQSIRTGYESITNTLISTELAQIETVAIGDTVTYTISIGVSNASKRTQIKCKISEDGQPKDNRQIIIQAGKDGSVACQHTVEN